MPPSKQQGHDEHLPRFQGDRRALPTALDVREALEEGARRDRVCAGPDIRPGFGPLTVPHLTRGCFLDEATGQNAAVEDTGEVSVEHCQIVPRWRAGDG